MQASHKIAEIIYKEQAQNAQQQGQTGPEPPKGPNVNGADQGPIDVDADDENKA